MQYLSWSQIFFQGDPITHTIWGLLPLEQQLCQKNIINFILYLEQICSNKHYNIKTRSKIRYLAVSFAFHFVISNFLGIFNIGCFVNVFGVTFKKMCILLSARKMPCCLLENSISYFAGKLGILGQELVS